MSARWWPTREPPEEKPTELFMDRTRREIMPIATADLAHHRVVAAAVCQEGCYPGKTRAHVNQDTFVLNVAFEGDANQCLLGVFDGHSVHGEDAAQIAAATLPRTLKELRADDAFENHLGDHMRASPLDGDDAAPSAFATAFERTNDVIVRELGEDAKLSGTTAVVAHLIGDMLHVANVGDSRAIFGIATPTNENDASPRWKVLPVTHDQTCFRHDERVRMKREATEDVMFATLGMILGEVPLSEDFGEETIEAADDPPRVFKNNEHYPGCAFTRSLGDTIGKSLGISAKPETLSYRLDDASRCLVIASDGVCEFLENKDVIAICERYEGDALGACEEITRAAYACWSEEDTRADDVTCVVSYFTPKPSAAKAPKPATAPSKAAEQWMRVRRQVRAGHTKKEPGLRFANAALAKAAIHLRTRRGSLAIEDLFPRFEWDTMEGAGVNLKDLVDATAGLGV
jgi:serine/threonine protein phosphatase PrpC